ncbi:MULTISPECIES: polysaccharide biosynthesis/export family protein [unclassified Rhizobium]|uniref:polysaccharide biosynthesis/export family protein n=1 Tax=unclassified Rhizobium TaxID=2613769 RepID=UPI0016080DCC|nr:MULTISPECIES: polysaccharide biosynthesis/export family protein [unclassified Rhizobium]MBB3318070.1 polysaccharide export outer membrane protein [Rhizobium sp. BK181]MBB3544950.1 polysaccharide export outer membrane protein [Rhizobium sp. BK399]MCS4095546.1 polysaccharide export outer membrane protein [Rhizobium sp. BK176]
MQEQQRRVRSSKFLSGISRAITFAVAASFLTGVCSAVASPLFPNTKIRLTLVQWMPTKGSYEQWATVGGEYTVSEEGTISVPLLGPISVDQLDEVSLASFIAKRLKEKIGLVDEPAATVEVLKYPPIYVVGDVEKPGEYDFHGGITVLQALAMGGGQRRAASNLQSSTDVTKMVGDLKEIDNSIVRSTVKIARLKAELAGEKSFQAPKENSDATAYPDAIYTQEQTIFSARANELSRQSKSLGALRDLLSEEIKVLEEKTKSTDLNIASIQQQLESTIALIEKGAIVATRQADVERVMRGYQNDRLDLTVAIMRARQSISQTTRDLEGLYDKRQTQIASDLQSEQATISQLRLKKETTQKLLTEALSSSSAIQSSEPPRLQFTIVRPAKSEKSAEIDASETSTMAPGDVLKVTLRAELQPLASNSSDEGEVTAPTPGQ